MTRQRRSPEERAQQALDLATRKAQRLAKREADLIAELDVLQAALAVARADVAYLAASPHLAKPEAGGRP